MLLPERIKSYRIILASHSPRRHQLMRDAGIAYTLADNYEVAEIYPERLEPEQVPVYLSELKSHAFPAPLAENEILITADTIVLLNETIIGKPFDREDAIRILGELSGNRHKVITGVTLRSADKTHHFSSHSYVYFRPLTLEEIVYYIDTYKPFDKAGAYGIQEWIGYVGIERIEGSFYNVMGLPIQQLYVELAKFVEKI